MAEPKTRRAIPAAPVDDRTRDDARRSAAGWAITQPDPAEALAEVLGALGLGNPRPARDPGRCGTCGTTLPVGSAAKLVAARQGLCTDCARKAS